MFRTVFNIRPNDNKSAVPYSPQRDIAYLYQPLLTEVFNSLESSKWSDDVRQILSKTGLSDEELDGLFGVAVYKFAEALRLFIRSPETTDPQNAFEKTGFSTEVLPEIQIAIYGAIGTSMTAGFFHCVREVTVQGDLAPAHDDFIRMLASAKAAARRYSGLVGPKVDNPHETIEMLNQTLEQQVREYELVNAQHMNIVAELQATAATASASAVELNLQLVAIQKVLPQIQTLIQNPTLLMKLKTACIAVWGIFKC